MKEDVGSSLTIITIMRKRNLEYEHGYAQGYEFHSWHGGDEQDAKTEICHRFGRRTIYTSYGKGFIQGFLDHKNGKAQKYS